MMEDQNPMIHPEEQPTGTDDAPKFGRLLIVLLLAVLSVVVLTYVSEKIYS